MTRIFTVCILLISFLFSPIRAQVPGQLIYDSLLLSFDELGLQAVYEDFGLFEPLFPIAYTEVEVYKLVYWTQTANGEGLIEASGLITIPLDADCDFPLVCYNHGRLEYDEAISDLNANGMQHFVGVPFAATGYVTVLPDYLGYGETPSWHPHAFTHASSEAGSVVDMLRAAKSFCAQKDIQLNDQLFLTGFSHGGHVTMALHRELEAFHPDEFAVTASAPGGGPYDLSGIMRDSMFYSTTYSNASYIAFTALSYQFVYGNIYNELSDIFISPYDTIIPLIFDRQSPQTHWNDSLPSPGYQMLQPDFVVAVLSDSLHPLNFALRENDVYRWTPLAPIRMYFCEADERIPYQNAEVAREYMVANGAPNVRALSVGEHLDHGACGPPAIIAAKLWFDDLRSPCSTSSIVASDPSSDSIKFYPNPFGKTLYFESGEAAGENPPELKIYDLSGKLLYHQMLRQGHELNIDRILPSPGIYIFEVAGENGQSRQQMIKGH